MMQHIKLNTTQLRLILVSISIGFFILLFTGATIAQETIPNSNQEGTQTESPAISDEENSTQETDDNGTEKEDTPKSTVSVRFSKNVSKVKELYGEGIVNHRIPISVSSDSFVDDYILINISVESRSDSLQDVEFQILTPTIVVPKKPEGEILGAQTYEIELRVNGDIKKEEIEELNLKIDITPSPKFDWNSENRYHTVEILDGKKAFEKENPFRIYVGTNFDFFDGASVDDIYGSAEVFLPNSFGKENRWGLIGGISQSQSLSFDSSEVAGISRKYFEQLPTANSDSVNVVSQSLDLSSRVSVNNTEMHINLFYNFLDGKNLKGHIGFQAMTVWRNYVYDYTYSNQSSETVLTSVNDVTSDVRTTPFQTPERRTRTYSDTYLGICVPLTYSSKYGEMFIQGGAGYLWIDEGNQIPYLNWKFRMTENKLGITLGGEIFAIIRGTNAEVNVGTNRLNTLYNIYVAKAFDLSKLTGYGE
jgi:hypothetical protein